jgi:hypothetical protein
MIQQLLGSIDIITSTTIMRAVSLAILIFIVIVFYLDAFVPNAPPQPRRRPHEMIHHETHPWSSTKNARLFQSPNGSDKTTISTDDDDDAAAAADGGAPLTHADIVWKLRPPPETPVWKRLWLRFAANLIRLDCLVFRKEAPVALCPKGGQAVLEAHCRNATTKRLEKVGRFGFTTERGPSAPPIQETVKDIYGLSPNVMVGVGAIIYMFVEPQYRKRNIGALALQIISLIHAVQGIDFTVLVVDDNGSGKLVEWYTQNGYSKAPKLQEILGSPNAVNGITMISPTNRILPYDCRIQWW